MKWQNLGTLWSESWDCDDHWSASSASCTGGNHATTHFKWSVHLQPLQRLQSGSWCYLCYPVLAHGYALESGSSVIHPSEQEGLPRKLGDVAACDRPVKELAIRTTGYWKDLGCLRLGTMTNRMWSIVSSVGSAHSVKGRTESGSFWAIWWTDWETYGFPHFRVLICRECLSLCVVWSLCWVFWLYVCTNLDCFCRSSRFSLPWTIMSFLEPYKRLRSSNDRVMMSRRPR